MKTKRMTMTPKIRKMMVKKRRREMMKNMNIWKMTSMTVA